MTSDDEDLTPRETPSAKLNLGLEACPACDRRGATTTGTQCSYCFGGKVVSREKAEKWRMAHRDTDPAPPSKGGKQ